MAGKLLNINELADYLNVNRRTIYRYLAQGKLPPPLKKWGCKRWDPEKVRAALESDLENTATNRDIA